MTLVFLHIEKVGGTTLSRVLEDSVEPGRVMPRPPLPYDRLTRPGDMTAVDSNRGFPDRYDPRYRLVRGHYDWGIVKHVVDPVVITVLRAPVPRCKSLYNFMCHERAFGRIRIQARQMGALRFMQSNPRPFFSQAAQIAGVRWSDGNGIVGPKESDTAMENLERCDFVGVTEHLDEFITYMTSELGFKVRRRYRLNAIPHKAKFGPRAADYVRGYGKYDNALYAAAREKCLRSMAGK
jgi:hypothetical protein